MALLAFALTLVTAYPLCMSRGAGLQRPQRAVGLRMPLASTGVRMLVDGEGEKVAMFGARLDSNVAGFDSEVVATKSDEEHERIFKDGVRAMQAGRYRDAVGLFTKATAASPGGLTSRTGGQYGIWLAQALQAAGRKKEATQLLKRCEAHPDGDVRKIADNVLYIFQAPELKLSDEMFIKIQPMHEQIDLRRRRGPPEKKDPPPEKYSIEWYVAEAARKKALNEVEVETPPASNTPIVVAAAVAVSICAIVAAK